MFWCDSNRLDLLAEAVRKVRGDSDDAWLDFLETSPSGESGDEPAEGLAEGLLHIGS
jgi:hypothetical protein